MSRGVAAVSSKRRRALLRHFDEAFVIAFLITRVLALGCIALVVSLPLRQTKMGTMLRRVAAAAFALAFAPSVFIGIAREVAPGLPHWLEPIVIIIGFMAVSIAAYLVWRIRKGPTISPRRIQTMQPYTYRRREDDIFAALREELSERDDG